ncbi:S41 family peptidase [Pelomonas sp. Root1444]|uniref:S41 family peptidase n=1 Tax=Pelomonas sp. Root1444 TaxID=1736464 RepID=UPI0007027457|nr:S41 family peptidase [Pelomonas sp. Root1444]KQY80199.1 peptidase S41 [Pelomonas sp. Root1444]
MTLPRIALALAWMTSSWAQAAEPTLMLRQPAVSKQHLAFIHGGDLWLADRSGGNARRLTSHAASEFLPRFSPDGKQIAFSASYDGNVDVYVIGLDGGQPKRLTWHPAPDNVSGWSPDGRRVLFASPREVLNNRSNQLYEVSVDGGYEKQVMKAVAYEGAWSADGKQLAFRPWRAAYVAESGWRQSRGGTTPPVWIMDMASQQWQEIPHVNASDSAPVWAGGEVVFISDRDAEAKGAANLFAFNPATKALRQLTRETQWDVRSVDAVGTTLVYEAGGRIKQIELAGGEPRVLDIQLASIAPQARPQWKDAGKALTSARLSSTGKRVVVSARGEVFTVPVKDGSVRNLTETAGVREKDALWSADGQRIAYISDAPGMRHELVLQAQSGLGAKERFLLPKDAYFTLADWSPDGNQLVLQDNHLNLYRMGLAAGAQRGKLVKVATDVRRGSVDIAFSPDSRWLAFTSSGDNYFGRIWLHDIATGRNHAVTDGLAHAGTPTFSAKGDYLYFTASINSGPGQVGLDLSTQERPRRAGIYALVLAADGKSPLAPKAGDEDGKKDEKKDEDKKDDKKGGDAKKDDKPKPEPVKPIKLDLDGLADRVVALPVAERNYDSLAVASDGALFYLQRPQPGASNEPPQAEKRATAELWRFDFEERKPKLLRTGIADYSLSEDHQKLLLTVAGGKLEVGDANDKGDSKPLDLAGLRARVDPKAEWKQIFDEAWWMEREFFYDPGMHGLDWQAVYDRYLPQLAHVQRREDLNDLLVQMIGELQVGHNRVGGGDVHQETPAAVGLLGADFSVEQGRYRIARLYAGDRLNPNLRSPLSVPGLGLKEGDFILAIGGHELDAKTNLYALLENTVDKQVVLSVAQDAKGSGRRDVVVEPIASEALLRRWAWIEGNRRKVEQKTGGKVAYVYMPDTGGSGFEHFNRMFFAQVDKQALIVDDRRNGGGQAANYVTELLARPYLGSWKDRDGLVFDTPGGAIYGPKAMLIDQDAGSGGDFMPYAFKRVGLGPLIGKRTWGGLIGISTNPPLIDGGFLTVPFFRFYTPEGEWRIENEGVAPDIDVELDPAAVNRGEDTQLDAAIADVMKRLAAWKPIQRKSAPEAAKLGR